MSLLPDPNANIELLYNASVHGYYNSDFHTKCDDKGPTLVIIKGNYRVFGGYTSQSWNSTSNGYVSDSKSFIFSLDNKEKYELIEGEEKYAIFCG